MAPDEEPSAGATIWLEPRASRPRSLAEERPARAWWLLAPPHGATVALALYLVATALFFGRGLLPHPGAAQLGVGTDPSLFQWGYAWWPHAILHGINPLWSHAIYSPVGIDIAHATMVPGPALVMSPVTAVFGPLVSFNVSEVLAPALAAWTTFLLCRRLIAGAPVSVRELERAERYRAAFVPALVGGWLFGFSSYMLGELEGHEQLTIVFLVPVLAHLLVRCYAGELSRRRATVGLALCLIGLFSVGEELFASATLFTAVALVVAALVGGADARVRLRAMLGPLVIAYVITLIVISPFLVYALKPGGEPVLYGRSAVFSGDLLGLIVPTPLARVFGTHFASTSARFTAGPVEGGNYFGIPLLALFGLGLWWGRRRRGVVVLALVALVAFVLSLGPYLEVDGHRGFALPWYALERLPLLGLVLPSRLVMYMWLVVAIVSALTLAHARSAPRALLAWLLAAASIVSLWPAVNRGLWHSDPIVPRLFTTSAYKRVIAKGQTVLIPPAGATSFADLWQADAHFRFNLAGGYALATEAPTPYSGWPIYPTLNGAPAGPNAVADARAFIAAQHITLAIIADQNLPGSPWPHILESLGWTARSDSGTLIFRPPAAGRG